MCWQDLKKACEDVQKERERASTTTCEWFVLQAMTKVESSKFHSRLRDCTSTLASELERPWQSEMNKELADIVETHLANEKEKEKKAKEKQGKAAKGASPKKLKRKKSGDNDECSAASPKKKRPKK